MEPGNIAHQVIESIPRHPARGVHINAVKPLHDFGMVRDIELRHNRLAKPLYLHIAAVVRANGNGGVYDIGNTQHYCMNLRLQLCLLLFQLSQAGGVCLDLLLDRLGFLELGRVLLGLPHQHTYLLTQGIAFCPQLAGLGNGGTILAVQSQDLVHQGKFFLLELLFYIFPDRVRVIPNEFNI